MNILDNAKKHFDDQEVKKIKVPEWGDEPGRPAYIYSNPLTLAEKGKIKKQTEQRGEIDAMIYVLILKANDGQGNKLFTVEDKRALKNKVDPDVLARVISEIMSAPSVDEMLD